MFIGVIGAQGRLGGEVGDVIKLLCVFTSGEIGWIKSANERYSFMKDMVMF